MLEELGGLFNESYGGFSMTRFDGKTILSKATAKPSAARQSAL
jgi:hypothetical protein